MSKTIEEILAPKPEARPRLYAYSIVDKAHAGLLKVGQTTPLPACGHPLLSFGRRGEGRERSGSASGSWAGPVEPDRLPAECLLSPALSSIRWRRGSESKNWRKMHATRGVKQRVAEQPKTGDKR